MEKEKGMKTSKYVESYFINEYESGIFSVMFNTTERWIGYHSYDSTTYIFGEIEENKSPESMNSRIQEIESFLPKGKTYIPTTIQNKDQITWYFIPIESIDRKAIKRKINY